MPIPGTYAPRNIQVYLSWKVNFQSFHLPMDVRLHFS